MSKFSDWLYDPEFNIVYDGNGIEAGRIEGGYLILTSGKQYPVKVGRKSVRLFTIVVEDTE